MDTDTPRKMALVKHCEAAGKPLSDHRIVRRLPGAPCRVGPSGPQPGAGAAGRSGADLIQYGLIRQCKAVLSQTSGDRCDEMHEANRWPLRPEAKSWRGLPAT